jgi:hypothetical protein
MPLAKSKLYSPAPDFLFREQRVTDYFVSSDPKAIREAVPEPLEPDGSHTFLYGFIKMPDSPGFGEYTETGIVIPCLYKKQPVNYTAQMYIDCDPLIATGCEIWGFTTNKKCTKPPDNCFYNKKSHNNTHKELNGRLSKNESNLKIQTGKILPISIEVGNLSIVGVYCSTKGFTSPS